jgi:hypothetical protein
MNEPGDFRLRRGSHPTRLHGMCAMEMVAWLAGEPHSDEPRCACPVLATTVRALNDLLPDDSRDRLLRPLVPRLIHTRAGRDVERRRVLLLVDIAVRGMLPELLADQGRRAAALELAAAPPIDSEAAALAMRDLLRSHAPAQRAAIWLLERFADGTPPARWLGGIARMLATGGVRGLARGVTLLSAAAAIGMPTAAPALTGPNA